MSLKLVSSTVVITARQFNPSIIRDSWLERHGILVMGDFEKGCVSTDEFANVHSREFNLLVVQGQLQFIPNVPFKEQQALIVEKVGTIVQSLPHTPFIAIGLNFTWHIVPEQTTVEEFTKGLFFREEHPLYEQFACEDARFGAYFSKNILGRRMKLDIKPINVLIDGDEKSDAVQFGFNFHLDLDQDNELVDQIFTSLKMWDKAYQEAKLVVEIATEGKVL